jgi:hypothetical protein
MRSARPLGIRFASWLPMLVVLPGFLVFAQKAEERPADRDSAKYVGTEVCQGCHEDAYRSFAKSAHEQTLKSKAAADRGCEACHGPGVRHVEAGGDPAKIWTYSDASGRTIVERCQRCHEISSSKEHTKGKEHCLNCHSSHHYQQLEFLLREAK